MLVLGIETSCDDTAVAIVEDGLHIHSNVISSQIKEHAPFGGVVPEIAARKHVEAIGVIIEKALEEAGVDYGDLGAIGVAARHGLLRSIVVGAAAAKSLAYSLNIPLIGVHHIEGHIYSNRLEHGDQLEFPHICLTVSGGHTLLLRVHAINQYELIGRTLDDAAGEVFDKLSKFLDLGFPGGPVIDRLAAQGKSDAFNFPRPMLNSDNSDFSFSGLKTAAIKEIEKVQRMGGELSVPDVAASFQQAVVDVLITKTLRATNFYGLSTISVCGGVAANKGLRKAFEERGRDEGLSVFYPRMSLCTDNGAMIAGLAYHKLKEGVVSDLRLDAQANAPLGAMRVQYK
jgi:N6-L-threonylcarbamoyladenine synthase